MACYIPASDYIPYIGPISFVLINCNGLPYTKTLPAKPHYYALKVCSSGRNGVQAEWVYNSSKIIARLTSLTCQYQISLLNIINCRSDS